MTTGTFVIETGAPDIEEGTYDAILKSIEEKSFDAPDGTREFLVWTFDAVIDGEPIEVSGASSKVFTPKSKAVEWMAGVMGHVPTVGEAINIARDLLDKPCRVLIAKNKNGYPKVEKVLAPSRKAQTTAARPTPAPVNEQPAVAAPVEDLNDLPF